MEGVPFTITDWASVPETVHPGEQGEARWRTVEADGTRIRRVVYGPGYRADHWCARGHVILVLEGELHTELADGRTFVLGPGQSYHVSDDASSHRSWTGGGATLFIVD
jgi:hypothetical protein